MAFPFLSVLKETDVRKKHRGVHRERHESLFFTANFKENFSTVCMMDFFLKENDVLMVINQNVLYHRGKKRTKTKSTFPTATPFLSTLRLSAVFPPVSQGGNLHKLVSGSSLKWSI